MSRTKAPNVSEHAAALRRAIALSGERQDTIASVIQVDKRTISNWTSRTKPTMPKEADQAKLNRLFPGYADQGDPVEVAISQAELAPFRRAELVAVYQRLLHEQSREEQSQAQ